MERRFTEADIDLWRREGAVLLPGFFTGEEIAPVHGDFEALYADRGKGEGVGRARTDDKGEGVDVFHRDQFRNFDDMPFKDAPALTLLGLHPALIALARAALGTEDVYLYQSHSWAKYTGEADYAQPFHCDYKNHTLTVPSDDVRLRTINIMIYATDVTDAHGAIHYVPNSLSTPITGEDRPMFLEDDLPAQRALREVELSGAAPAGSIFAYGIDVYHRGTNLTAPGAKRYTLTASFKAKGNDMIGWTAWPFTFTKPWHLIFDTATPDQLSCIGVPRPGDPFWTARTLKRTKERWPGWDMSAYESAL